MQVLQLGKQVVVDKVFQRLAGHTFRVGGPGTPAATVGNGRAVVVVHQLPFQLAVIEDFQEQQPNQLSDALGVAVYANVFAHDVLDGLDGGANGHEVLSTRTARGAKFYRIVGATALACRRCLALSLRKVRLPVRG
ncbi:hypothetical protein D3C87_1441210 [compost metagenome]